MKKITNYEDYAITENGEVYSLKYGKLKLMVQQYNQKGYKIVRLSNNNIKKTLSVHRIVAQEFIPNPFNKEQVNHIDGDKTNNNINNLEWTTQSENQIHAHKIGLMNYKIQKTIEKFSKPVLDKETGIYYDSLKNACATMKLKYKSEFARMKYYNNSRFIQI